MKKFSIILVALLMILCINSTAFAAGESADAPVVIQGTPIGTAGISSSGRNVTFNAVTSSAETEDVLIATAYLQELRNGTWYTISSVTNSANNTTIVGASKVSTVSGGYYYRTKGEHTTSHSGVLKSVTTYSPQKWVS